MKWLGVEIDCRPPVGENIRTRASPEPWLCPSAGDVAFLPPRDAPGMPPESTSGRQGGQALSDDGNEQTAATP